MSLHFVANVSKSGEVVKALEGTLDVDSLSNIDFMQKTFGGRNFQRAEYLFGDNSIPYLAIKRCLSLPKSTSAADGKFFDRDRFKVRTPIDNDAKGMTYEPVRELSSKLIDDVWG